MNGWSRYAAALAAIAATVILAVVLRPGVPTEWLNNGHHLRVGETVRPAEDITLEAASTGTVRLEGGARLKLTGPQAFTLERGTIHALIWAPAAQFVIDTPAAKAIDLGCRYTLRVEGDGSGILHVETGWVAFQTGDRESFIPAGASCRTYVRQGPGTPYQAEASSGFRDGVDAFDTGHAEALQPLLRTSQPADALTLWHLLSRTKGSERALVYDRLAGFVSLPAREAVLRGDPDAISAAWNALGYGDTGWWRSWKRPWGN